MKKWIGEHWAEVLVTVGALTAWFALVVIIGTSG